MLFSRKQDTAFRKKTFRQDEEGAKLTLQLSDFPSKEQLGHIRRPIRLLFIGTINADSGLETILPLFRSLSETPLAEGMELSIVGEGKPEYTQQLVSTFKDLQNVIFRGAWNNSRMSKIIRAHDVFISCRLKPPFFTLAHVQAMASGTPVVSTAGETPPLDLVHEQTALLVSCASPELMLQEVFRLAVDQKLSRKIAFYGRRVVERKYAEQDESLGQRLHGLGTRMFHKSDDGVS